MLSKAFSYIADNETLKSKNFPISGKLTYLGKRRLEIKERLKVKCTININFPDCVEKEIGKVKILKIFENCVNSIKGLYQQNYNSRRLCFLKSF